MNEKKIDGTQIEALGGKIIGRDEVLRVYGSVEPYES